MSEFDAKKLLSDIDPEFRKDAQEDYGTLLSQSVEAAEDELSSRQFETAMKILAASIYSTAKECDLNPDEMGVVAAYTLGMLSGASCESESGTIDELKVLFSDSLDAASEHKAESVEMVAGMVIDGLALREGQTRKPISRR